MFALCQKNMLRNFRIWIFCATFKKAFISNQAEHFISVIVYPLLLWDEKNRTFGETFFIIQHIGTILLFFMRLHMALSLLYLVNDLRSTMPIIVSYMAK